MATATMTTNIEADRKRFREIQNHASFVVGKAAFRNAVSAILPANPTSEDWVYAAETARVTCPKCHGTGWYSWGGTVNGKPVHVGECYQCSGTGVQDAEDFARNHYYILYAISNAVR